jgi:hypothetical protein
MQSLRQSTRYEEPWTLPTHAIVDPAEIVFHASRVFVAGVRERRGAEMPLVGRIPALDNAWRHRNTADATEPSPSPWLPSLGGEPLLVAARSALVKEAIACDFPGASPGSRSLLAAVGKFS